MFVTTATEKLLTYALGRAARYYDMPTVRSHRSGCGAGRLSFLEIHSGNRARAILFKCESRSPMHGCTDAARKDPNHELHHQEAHFPAHASCEAWASRCRCLCWNRWFRPRRRCSKRRRIRRPGCPASTFRTGPSWTSGRPRRRGRASSLPRSSSRSSRFATISTCCRTSRIRRRAAWAAMPARTISGRPPFT